MTNIESATPDPSLAVYDNPPESIDWPVVVACGTVLVTLTGLFVWWIKR